jgi:hypothetical protein
LPPEILTHRCRPDGVLRAVGRHLDDISDPTIYQARVRGLEYVLVPDHDCASAWRNDVVAGTRTVMVPRNISARQCIELDGERTCGSRTVFWASRRPRW